MLSRVNMGVIRQTPALPMPVLQSRKRNDVDLVLINGMYCTIEPINGSKRVIVDVLGKGRIIAPNRKAVDGMVSRGDWCEIDAVDDSHRKPCGLRGNDRRMTKFADKTRSMKHLPKDALPECHVRVQRVKVRGVIVYVVRHRVGGTTLNFGIVPDEATCLEFSKKTLDVINNEIRRRNNQGKDQDIRQVSQLAEVS